MRHDLERLLRQASACGWQVARTRGGHWRLLHPSGGIVVMSSTPGDRRALLNMRAQLRRAERRAVA
jgi:predicted RNA binding protein YcfA (HicA-like mRNA interferase family)